jgi:hypothetical protein
MDPVPFKYLSQHSRLALIKKLLGLISENYGSTGGYLDMATLPNFAAATAEAIIGRRGASRARLQLNASLETTTGATPIVIRNLSCTGALLEGSRLPRVNRTAVLKRDGIDAMGIVVWQEENRCGFLFFDPVSHEQVVEAAASPPEAPVRSDPLHWELSEPAVTAEDWRKAQQAILRQRSGLRGFS